MWYKTVLCVSCVVVCASSEDTFEDNHIDDDFLLQDLALRTKKSPAIFDIVDKNVAERDTESEDDIKYILAKDIKQRIAALKELDDAFEDVKLGIDSNKREIKDNGNSTSLLQELLKTSHETEISPDSSDTEDELSRTARQYYPLNNRYVVNAFSMPQSSPISYDTENNPSHPKYNPSPRTFPVAGVGGFEANIRGGAVGGGIKEGVAGSGVAGGIKEGVAGGGSEIKGGVGGEVIKDGGVQGGFVKHDHGSGGGFGVGGGHGIGGGGFGVGGVGGVVHPIKQIKYLLPNFLSALTAAIGGVSGSVAGFSGGGGGAGGFGVAGGGFGGGLGGGLGGKHKHKPAAVTVHKKPIKIKPLAHAPTTATHVVPIKKDKEKGSIIISKHIFIGKLGGESQKGSYFPEGNYNYQPSYSGNNYGGNGGYSYLSPFNVQYADRSPYYMPVYLPDAQSSYGAGLVPYQQANSYFEPSYLPYSQGQYYYPVESKSLNNEGSLPILPQFQSYQDPTISSNPITEDAKTDINPDSYVRSSLDKLEKYSPSEANLEMKSDIEEEQRRIRQLQDGLKHYAEDLNINPDEGKSNSSLSKEVDDLKTGWDGLKKEMKNLNEHSKSNLKKQ